jgi:hypothetical protein
MSPDATGHSRDHPGDESDNRANEHGRNPEFERGKWGSGRIDEQANEQPGDSATHPEGSGADDRPSRKHRQASQPGGEPHHMPDCRIPVNAGG